MRRIKISPRSRCVHSAFGLLFFVGCVGPSIVGALDVRPKTNMETSDRSIALALGDNVLDTFVVPKKVYMSDMQVHGWHTTLRNGFENGILPAFKTPQGQADLTVRLEKTEIFFEDKSSTATVQTAAGSGTAVRTRVVCNIMYQAFLLDSEGERIAKSIGTASHGSNSYKRVALVEGAVEELFQAIARELLVNPSAQAGAAQADEAKPDEAQADAAKADCPVEFIADPKAVDMSEYSLLEVLVLAPADGFEEAMKPKLRKKVCAAGGTAIYIQGRVELALKKGTKYAIVRKDGPVPEGAELTCEGTYASEQGEVTITKPAEAMLSFGGKNTKCAAKPAGGSNVKLVCGGQVLAAGFSSDCATFNLAGIDYQRK